VLSRDCDGCGEMQFCAERFKLATRGEKVSCPNGERHLID
jgi:hypothetical protein